MNRGYITGARSGRNVKSCKPIMHQLWNEAMRIANTRKMYCPDFGCSSGHRGDQHQNILFRKGRDDVGQIVYPNLVVTNCDGYLIKSVHQSGYAFDIFAIHPDTGLADYRPESLALVATCFYEAASNMGVDMDWGGSFRSISDGPHIEIRGMV